MEWSTILRINGKHFTVLEMYFWTTHCNQVASSVKACRYIFAMTNYDFTNKKIEVYAQQMKNDVTSPGFWTGKHFEKFYAIFEPSLPSTVFYYHPSANLTNFAREKKEIEKTNNSMLYRHSIFNRVLQTYPAFNWKSLSPLTMTYLYQNWSSFQAWQVKYTGHLWALVISIFVIGRKSSM